MSIASVSRVLNGLESPRPETRERVMAAVRELDFVPDGAARALSSRLKEVVGVVFRRPFQQSMAGSGFADEDGSLLFAEVINRGVELAARQRGFDLLLSSVDVYEPGRQPRVAAMASKSDGPDRARQGARPGGHHPARQARPDRHPGRHADPVEHQRACGQHRGHARTDPAPDRRPRFHRPRLRGGPRRQPRQHRPRRRHPDPGRRRGHQTAHGCQLAGQLHGVRRRQDRRPADRGRRAGYPT